jgi:hypothetical protein
MSTSKHQPLRLLLLQIVAVGAAYGGTANSISGHV